MYTILYVLTDSEKLSYYNELLISLKSLRLHMKEQRVCILLDKNTYEILENKKRTELKDVFHAETLVIEINENYSQKEKSRYLKIKTRELVSGTILFLDSDTVLAGALPDEISNSDLAMAEDYNAPFSERPDYEDMADLNLKYNYHLEKNTCYFNSGVIWARDKVETRAFFSSWFSEWDRKRNIGVLDQPSLNEINRKMGGVISTLDNRYNLQINALPSPVAYLSGALIIHYFNTVQSSPFLLNDRSCQSIEYDSEEMEKIIFSPLSAFKKSMIVEADSRTIAFLSSRIFRLMIPLHSLCQKIRRKTMRLLHKR